LTKIKETARLAGKACFSLRSCDPPPVGRLPSGREDSNLDVSQIKPPRNKAAPLVLTAGFRFFFLSAGLFAVVSMAAWLAWLGLHAGGAAIPAPTISVAPHLWHGHEMIFGYAVAVLAGFFLTAVPSWTGAPAAPAIFVSVTGTVWLAGRLAVWFSAWLDPFVVALIDLAFLPPLMVRIGLNLRRRPQPHNVVLLGLLTMILAGNLLVHLEWTGLTTDTAGAGLRLGLLTIAALIAIIGGRIIPGFTKNALVRRGVTDNLPVNHGALSKGGIVTAVLLAPAVAAGLPDAVLGALALAAALLNGARLAGWRWRDTLGEPILWSLHLGFVLLVLGYGVLAASFLTGWPHEVAALHATGAGAVGCMTLAMMSRAALGHTGRALTVSRGTALAYLAIAAAALIRAFGVALAPGLYNHVMMISGGLWVTGFALFVVAYWPILTGPNQRRQRQSEAT
jgi:uncharacterized protein involved in response to NO